MVIRFVKLKYWPKQNLTIVKLHIVGTTMVLEVQIRARLAQSITNHSGKPPS